jgi:hypothetical protein
MRLHVQLFVVLFAVHARAATIHNPSVPDIEKRLPTVENVEKDIVPVPIDNVSSEQELIDSANSVKDVENNLRVKTVEKIPVNVIVEEPKVDDDSEENFKRVEIDLNNPGEPQRQEHETQNPVHHEDEQRIVATFKQAVLETESDLNQGLQGIGQGLQNWSRDQLTAIQARLETLRENFVDRLDALNKLVQAYLNNRNSENTVEATQPENKPDIDNVENHLKSLEENFKVGIKALTEGINTAASLKQETPTTTPESPSNILTQLLSTFQSTISQGFNNITTIIQNNLPNNNSTGILSGFSTGIQNILNPNQGSSVPSEAQSDTPTRPTIWQGIQNFLNPTRNPSAATEQDATNPPNAAPNRPIVQAIQNLPIVQGVVSLIQPTTQPQLIKPSEAPSAPEGSNEVPAKESKPEPGKVNEEQTSTNGPIQNIIQNNPIVKGISGAVQKLQSLSNPEKPRDEESNQVKDVGADAKGHGVHYGGTGIFL